MSTHPIDRKMDKIMCECMNLVLNCAYHEVYTEYADKISAIANEVKQMSFPGRVHENREATIADVINEMEEDHIRERELEEKSLLEPDD